MDVILLESLDKLGKVGDIVNVKNGFARNFLFPQKKALRANKENKENNSHNNISLETKVIEKSLDSKINFDSIDNANAYYSERYGWTLRKN